MIYGNPRNTLLDCKCVAFLPVAAVPLWQLTQLPVTPEWLKVAPSKLVNDLWQSSQTLFDWTVVRVLADRRRAIVAADAIAGDAGSG